MSAVYIAEFLFVTGPSGSGKSTFTSPYLEVIRLENKKFFLVF
jgi:ABC-type lipoprotein export system ATPase subunit